MLYIYKSLILQEANGWCEEGAYDLLRKTLGEMSRKTAERSKYNRDSNNSQRTFT